MPVLFLLTQHFSTPILLLSRSEWGQKNIELVLQPAGTGQVLTSFDASSEQGQKLDVAIALTEALIAGIAKGRQDIKLVGSYVKSSLVWAVITGSSKEADKYQSIGDLKGSTIGISRVGSGSQVSSRVIRPDRESRLSDLLVPSLLQIMASVMAMQQGWTDSNGKVSELSFKVNNTFENLRNSVNDGSTSAFMWETFTTQKFFDSGEVRKIGEVPTPWPSWSIAASENTVLQSPERREVLDTFLQKLQEEIISFTSKESLAAGRPQEIIPQEFHYTKEHVDRWLPTVRWVGDARGNTEEGTANALKIGQDTKTSTVSRQMLISTLKTLQQAGVLTEEQVKLTPDVFVDAWGNGKEGRLVE